jgi:hypothetical protein
MGIRDCLSVLELAAYRAGQGDQKAEEHLADCARCRALLASLPDMEPPPEPNESGVIPRLAAREIPKRPAELTTGQIWTAVPENQSDVREVVVVLARQAAVDNEELVLIAPVDTCLDNATSTDLIVDRSPLGYRHLVSVGLQGPMLTDQLERYLGRLERPERQALADIYSQLFGAGEGTSAGAIGLSLTGAEDPRASARAARAEELRPLFAPADRLLGQEDEPLTFGALLAGVIESAEWDRPSVLTATGVSGASLDRMLEDRLDLTDRSDVADVRRVINLVQLEDWRDPVSHSLRRSPGGLRVATGGEPAIAARSFAGVSDAERERDLMRDQTGVDKSPEARERATESYLAELEKELDDAG